MFNVLWSFIVDLVIVNLISLPAVDVFVSGVGYLSLRWLLSSSSGEDTWLTRGSIHFLCCSHQQSVHQNLKLWLLAILTKCLCLCSPSVASVGYCSMIEVHNVLISLSGFPVNSDLCFFFLFYTPEWLWVGVQLLHQSIRKCFLGGSHR